MPPAEPSETAATPRVPRAPTRTVKQQIKALADVDLQQLPRDSIVEWPKVLHRGKRYIPEEWLTRKRKRTSWISDHGDFIVEEVDGKLGSGSWWCCKHCDKVFNAIATSSASTHLNAEHRQFDAAKEDHTTKKPKQSVLAMQMSAAAAVPIVKPTAVSVRKALLAYIIHNDLPFTTVEDIHFRELLELLNPHFLHKLVPLGETTIRRWISDRFEEEEEAFQRTLASTKYAKHISFDIWTSPNSHALLGIVVHFVDSQFQLQTKLLRIVQLHGAHTGDAQAAEILKVIRDFGIEGDVSYFQCDNVSSNDTCIAALLAAINQPRWPHTPDEKKERRLRCLGHIVNLCARAFIEANNKQWREEDRFGPIGKLHRIVHYIRRSPQRRNTFLDIAKYKQACATTIDEFDILLSSPTDLVQLQLVADNDTRWNSVLAMIERAIRLREIVDLYCASERDGLARNDALIDEDWLTLTEIRNVLKPFAIVTKMFEGNGVTISNVVLALQSLLKSLKEDLTRFGASQTTDLPPPEIPEIPEMAPPPTPSRRPQRQAGLPRRYDDCILEQSTQRTTSSQVAGSSEQQPTPPTSLLTEETDGARFIRAGIRAAILKLDEYCDLLDDSSAYWIAMILHPSHKTLWMKKNLQPHQVDSRVAALKRCFEDHYAHKEVSSVQEVNKKKPEDPAQDRFFASFNYKDDDASDHEIDRYLSTPPIAKCDPLQWWKANVKEYPRLSTMAFNYLSIPAMSSECERIFSRSKHTITHQRHSLHAETINMLQCLKNWAQNNEI